MMETLIRKLAKTNKALNLFNAAKEIHTIKIFKNEFDLSKIQVSYLAYLFFYQSLHTDIVLNKVDKKILDNYIYEDAYSLWSEKSIGKEAIGKNNKSKKEEVSIVFGK